MHTLRAFFILLCSTFFLVFGSGVHAAKLNEPSAVAITTTNPQTGKVKSKDAVRAASPSPVVNPGAAGASEQTSESANLQEMVQQTIARDLTETAGPAKSRLAAYLDSHPADPLMPWNALQHVIRRAVDKGVPANTLVLLLLFPVTATLIAIFRHVIGLRGFGVYTPAVLAVAFLSTGLPTGILLFGLVFLVTTLGKALVANLRLQYLPRTALLIWFVSLAMFVLMVLAPELSLTNIVAVGIFPILVLVLLSENFLEAEQMGSLRGAVQLTLETLFLAGLSAVFMRTLPAQEFVILHPEFTILSVFVLNVLVGRYTGLRVMELLRFRSVLEPEE